MTAPRLPDDVSQWPDDPHALLGVEVNADRRAVKSAYTALIRIYKPEHAPEQFRKIRDAYELINQYLAWRAAYSSPEPDQTAIPPTDGDIADPRPTEIDDKRDSRHGPLSEPVKLRPEVPARPILRPTQYRDAEDGVWALAKQGQAEKAYAWYVRSVQQGCRDDEHFVRLYWLLTVAPELNPKRHPCGWLLAGAKTIGLTGRLAALYARHLSEHPEEALGGRCLAIVNCTGKPGPAAEIVARRWQAAIDHSRLDYLYHDLPALRGRFHEDLDTWGQLLLVAYDHLVWSRNISAQSHSADILAEIEALTEDFPALTPEVNRRDVLPELAEACSRLNLHKSFPSQWRQALRNVVRDSWTKSFEDVRHRLIEVVGPLVDNPFNGMTWLDLLAATCRPVLHQFANLIFTLADEEQIGRHFNDPAVLLGRLIEFLAAASKGRYPRRFSQLVPPNRDHSGRMELLMFSFQERITMRHVADLLAMSQRADLAQFLPAANNASAHLICLAYQAFWA